MDAALDPSKVHPGPGKVLVEIVEQLGGTTKGGIFVPPTTQHHHGKDTAFGKVIELGPRPAMAWKDDSAWPVSDPDAVPWPDDFPRIESGEIACFPRDVPLAWSFEGKRYALVMLHEIIFVATGDYEGIASLELVPRPR